ncbi:hypothetical protein ES708_21087 [subsurface metagenome]
MDGFNCIIAPQNPAQQNPNNAYSAHQIPNHPPNQNYPLGPIYQGRSIQNPPKTEWYKDRSIYGLILIVIGLILILFRSIFLGLLCSIIAIILAVSAKKSNGKTSVVTKIFIIIVVVIGLVIGFFLLVFFTVLFGIL